MSDPVTWFSIPSKDPASASEFYAKAFGWDIQPATQEKNSDYDYLVALNSPSDGRIPEQKGRINGCIVKDNIGIPHPVVLINVDNLDEAAGRIKAAGGRLIGEVVRMDSLNGSFFLAKDLDGNVMEVFHREA